MTNPTHPAIRLYATYDGINHEIAANRVNNYDDVRIGAERLLSCHRAIMAEEVAPLLEALQAAHAMLHKLTARIPKTAAALSETAACMADIRQTLKAWEKSHAG